MSYHSDMHHRRSVRLKEYDYSSEGLYFITICTQDKKCMFGRIADENMYLNETGRMMERELMRTQQIRPNMVIHEYVIMPNHIHFIVEITHCRGGLNPPDDTNETNVINIMGNGQRGCIQGGFNPPLRWANTIGSMVRGLKSSMTKQLGRSIFQRNYYEHIIRNQHSYEEISDYIITNPSRWEKDQLFVKQ